MDDGFKSFYREVLEKELAGVLPAELLERYEVTSCLAHRKHSEIYLVSRREDGALGILRVGKADAWENAQAEFDILRRLDHPGIPKAMDVFSWAGKGFLVREYMDGQTLDKYVQTHGPLKQAETIAISAAICDILTVLHSQTPPIIHRDIKPENIIIDQEGRPKLIDFGIARIYRDKATSDTIAIGTRAYMAPEQFGASQTDARADIYSLGVVLIFLGTQSPDRANLRQRYPHKALLPIIQKCLKYDPDKRYSKAVLLKRALLGVQRTNRRHVLLAAGAGVLLLGAAGGGAFFAHKAGYDSGMTNGLTQGMQAGFSQGYAQGEKTGYADGQTAGYETGYQEGLAAGRGGIAAEQPGETQQGNTNGNYANRALCATDGKHIYYSDGGTILQADMQTENAKVFCTQPGENLSAYGEYLYFTNENGVWRAGLEDGTVSRLTDTDFANMMVIDDQIYGVEETTANLHRMDLDGGNLTKVNDWVAPVYLNLEDGWMVFSDGGGGNRLTKVRLSDGESVVLDDTDAHWINAVDGAVYYTQYDGGTGVYKIPLEGGERLRIADVSAAYTNVSPHGIFFANGYDRSRLYWMPPEGGVPVRLGDAAVKEINVVGDWIFFRNRDAEDALYCISADELDAASGAEASPATVRLDL